MATPKQRLIKAILVGVIWIAMRVPTDWALWKCSQNVAVLPYAVGLQLMDAALVVYLFYKLLQYQIRKPWKCPACDGRGRRFYVPGDSKEHFAQLEKCAACNGSGLIWEILSEMRLEAENA